jgi:hypothetical protein
MKFSELPGFSSLLEQLAMDKVQKHSNSECYILSSEGKGKVIPVQAVEAVEVLTFSYIRLIDGGKVVSPTRWPLFTLRKIPGTHFC